MEMEAVVQEHASLESHYSISREVEEQRVKVSSKKKDHAQAEYLNSILSV